MDDNGEKRPQAIPDPNARPGTPGYEAQHPLASADGTPQPISSIQAEQINTGRRNFLIRAGAGLLGLVGLGVASQTKPVQNAARDTVNAAADALNNSLERSDLRGPIPPIKQPQTIQNPSTSLPPKSN